MVISTSIRCCLNFPPSPSLLPSNSSNSKPPNQVPWPWNNNAKWMRQCLLGMAACVVIGTVDGAVANDQSQVEVSDVVRIESKKRSSSTIPRWSEKRTCPPWRLNSLETIVPENLPRPYARRRSEAISNSGNTHRTVTVAAEKAKEIPSCFSM